LGIEVANSKQRIFISQKNVLDLPKETGKLGYKHWATPIS